MNRRIIIFTIIIMTMSLIGLMSIQIYWIKNASSVKEATFRSTVNDVVSRIISNVERLEKNKAMQINQYERMLNFTRHLPYETFITMRQLDSLISLELNLKGIDTKYVLD